MYYLTMKPKSNTWPAMTPLYGQDKTSKLDTDGGKLIKAGIDA